METASDPYEDVAFVYMRLLRQECAEAAAAIEHIRVEFGSHAALRAALIMQIVKMEVQQNHWLPSMNLYAYLLEDFPDALPLAEYAMKCCLQSWGVPVKGMSEWTALATA